MTLKLGWRLPFVLALGVCTIVILGDMSRSITKYYRPTLGVTWGIVLCSGVGALIVGALFVMWHVRYFRKRPGKSGFFTGLVIIILCTLFGGFLSAYAAVNMYITRHAYYVGDCTLSPPIVEDPGGHYVTVSCNVAADHKLTIYLSRNREPEMVSLVGKTNADVPKRCVLLRNGYSYCFRGDERFGRFDRHTVTEQ